MSQSSYVDRGAIPIVTDPILPWMYAAGTGLATIFLLLLLQPPFVLHADGSLSIPALMGWGIAATVAIYGMHLLNLG
jgi:hypothetical protein